LVITHNSQTHAALGVDADIIAGIFRALNDLRRRHHRSTQDDCDGVARSQMEVVGQVPILRAAKMRDRARRSPRDGDGAGTGRPEANNEPDSEIDELRGSESNCHKAWSSR
jgi:hypothetical protein